MRSFLLQPYPFSQNPGRKLAVCGGIGAFITLFLVVFKPFGFNELPAAAQWLHAFLFGAVTFGVSALFQTVLPKIFPSIFREEGWRSWKEISYLLVNTVFIGAANYGLIHLLYPQNASLAGFLKAQLITFEIGIFPVLFVVFLKQLRLFRRFSAQAEEASKDIHTVHEIVPKPPVSPAQKVQLRGEGQREELLLLPDELFFVSSADNYVNVHFCEGGVRKSLLMRSSLKKIEEQLAVHPEFFRCHRTYIVNLRSVDSVSGNAQGLKLHLSGLEEAVPVSRNLTEGVKERLHRLSRSPQNA